VRNSAFDFVLSETQCNNHNVFQFPKQNKRCEESARKKKQNQRRSTFTESQSRAVLRLAQLQIAYSCVSIMRKPKSIHAIGRLQFSRYHQLRLIERLHH